jgi:aspartyl-tRNA(Asn)/glutamyl-tRNA(Gln) amidotransferase subunit A
VPAATDRKSFRLNSTPQGQEGHPEGRPPLPRSFRKASGSGDVASGNFLPEILPEGYDPTMDFRKTNLQALAAGVRSGDTSARDLAEHALGRIDALNGALNAFVALDGERALADADEIDRRVRAGEDVGALAGIPVGIKDLEDAAGFATSKGSALFAGRPPVKEDSALVARLKAAGCVVVGKTNTPELGHKGDTLNPTFGATKNPWNVAHSPGGSSGGSSAAVAAGMVPLATASDGGGSIRIPAALCGLPGFKPSLGRVSGGPGPADWPLLSTKGVLARSVPDTVLALDAVIGPDPTDLRSLPMPDAPWLGALVDARVPMQVAWSPTLGYARPDTEVLSIVAGVLPVLAELGAEIVEVESVFDEDPVWPWVTLVAACERRTLRPFADDPGWGAVDPSLQTLLTLGESLTGEDVIDAEDACHRMNLRLVELFRSARLLVCPVVAAAAPLSGQLGVIDGEPQTNWVQYTYPFNCTRSPAGSVHVGTTASGLPVGVQLVGPQHADVLVLRAMAALEAAVGLPTLPGAQS